MKTYKVKEINKDLRDDHHLIWDDIDALIDFSSPWDNKPIKKIEFKACHNSKNIFFRFKVDDNNIYIDPSKNSLESINNSDRVELFFRSDANLNPYYCLEIDPNSRIMDFKAYPNKKFDFNWNWSPDCIEVKSNKNTNFFTVEITISILFLEKIALLKGSFLETGIYRAKYNKRDNNTYYPTWITWVDPKTATPNFHTPESFGLLELENFIKTASSI